MFERIIDFFRGQRVDLSKDATGQPTDQDLQIAVAVALLEISGSDDEHAPDETRAIFTAMESQLNIHSEEVLRLLEIADEVRTDENRVAEFYTLLNSRFSVAQKQKLFAMIWRVVLADGRVDKYEMRLATQLRFRLQLSDAAMEEAKRMVEQGVV